MAHSLGVTGATYASGTRVMPGGSAFTLTGVFIDRITPRLMAVGAAARAQAAQINAMGTKLGRMTAYLDRYNNSLADSRNEIKRLAQQRLYLKRMIDAQNASTAAGIRLMNQEEKAALGAFSARRAALTRQHTLMRAQRSRIVTRLSYSEDARLSAIATGTAAGRADAIAISGKQLKDKEALRRLNKEMVALRAISGQVNREEAEFLAKLRAAGVAVDGLNRKKLEAIGLQKVNLEQIDMQIKKELVHEQILRQIVRDQEQRILLESSLTNIMREQVALMGGKRAVGATVLKTGVGLGIAAGAISGISLIPAANTMMGFEQELARIRAIGRFSTQEMWGMGKYTTGMSQQYALSPEAMLGGSLVGVKAGYRDIAELQGMLVPSMQLAIVNGEELDGVMEQLIMTMNAFHIETTRANEVIANQQTLINNSLLQFSDYTDGMKYAAAWANELGLSYEEVGAMIATMTDAGVRAGISGRSLRRMFSKFADDMDVIAQKIKQGGTSLDYFSEDGVLNVRALIESLSEGVDNVEEMQFALDRFGLRGAQSFLLLSQNLERYDELLAMQTGDTEQLAKMAEEAQNTISGQWQLLKNTLREPLLSETLVVQMRELVRYLREEGGLKDLANTFATIVENAIRWLRGGGFRDMVKIVQNLAKIFADMQPVLLGITTLLTKIGKYWYIALPIARMMKANTIMNMLAKTMLLFYAAQRGGFGGFSGPIAGGLGVPGGRIISRSAAAARTAELAAINGAGLTRGAAVAGAGARVAGGAGMAGIGTGLAVGSIATISAIALYALWKRGQDEQNAHMERILSTASAGARNEYNFYGDTYGVDNIRDTIDSVNTNSFSYQQRKM